PSATATSSGSAPCKPTSRASTRPCRSRASTTSGWRSRRRAARGRPARGGPPMTGLGPRRALRALAVPLRLALASAPPGHAQPPPTPKKGGVLRVANLGEPPTLDAHWTTATLTEVLTNHLYEGLYALDEGYRPVPMLAEGMPVVSKDGLTYTFKLRAGVKFHNGKEMTSADVVASLVRWGQQSQYGRALYAVVADTRAPDPGTVELRLKQKYAAVVVALAAPNNFAAIYPKEIAEKFKPAEKVTEFVGTGPFKLADWKPDQYIRMTRF